MKKIEKINLVLRTYADDYGSGTQTEIIEMPFEDGCFYSREKTKQFIKAVCDLFEKVMDGIDTNNNFYQADWDKITPPYEFIRNSAKKAGFNMIFWDDFLINKIWDNFKNWHSDTDGYYEKSTPFDGGEMIFYVERDYIGKKILYLEEVYTIEKQEIVHGQIYLIGKTILNGYERFEILNDKLRHENFIKFNN